MLRADALKTTYPMLRDQVVVTIMGAVAAELAVIRRWMWTEDTEFWWTKEEAAA